MNTTFQIENELLQSANAVCTIVVAGEPGHEVFKIYVTKSKHIYDYSQEIVECLQFTTRQAFAQALVEICFGEWQGQSLTANKPGTA